MTTGVNLQTSLANIKAMMQENLRLESLRNYVGGNSTVLLYMINSGNLQNNQAVWEEARAINDTVPGKFYEIWPNLSIGHGSCSIYWPFKIRNRLRKSLKNITISDLRVLFATSTNQFDALWNLVRDMHNDIKTISLTTAGTNVELVMDPVLERIQQSQYFILYDFTPHRHFKQPLTHHYVQWA